jgi:hypothetical protein
MANVIPAVIGYKDVQDILGKAAGKAHPFHDTKGRFWELPLEQFVALVIYNLPLVAPFGPGRGASSNLVKALRGEAPFDGTTFARMPLARQPVSVADIQKIQDWIDAGCKADPTPATAPVHALLEAPSAPAPINIVLRSDNSQREAIGARRIRKNVSKLTDADPEAIAFRAAIKALKDLKPTDTRNYINQAQVHAEYCYHNSVALLPWHRIYLYRFELLLQDFVPGVTLPYWDWVKDREIPLIFKFPKYKDTRGIEQDNPLYDERRWPLNLDQVLPTADQIAKITQLPDSPDFLGTWPQQTGERPRRGKIEDPHDSVHNRVGGSNPNDANDTGDMGDAGTSARDPIFWTHHSNLDRLWAKWQKDNPGAIPRPWELSVVLDPWQDTIANSLSIQALGYEYAEESAMFLAAPELKRALVTTATATLSANTNGARFNRAHLDFHAVQYPRQSFELLVFVNEPAPSLAAATATNPKYAGKIPLFGKKFCSGGAGHCDPKSWQTDAFDRRGRHRMSPFDMRCDVTEALKSVGTSEVSFSFLAVGPNGNALSNVHLEYDALSLVLID